MSSALASSSLECATSIGICARAKAGEGFAEARLRVADAGREAHAAARQRGHRHQIVTLVTRRARRERLRGNGGFVGLVRREVDVDQQRQERRRGGAQRIDLVERALEDVAGERRVALCQMDRGDRAGGLGVGSDVDVGEQLLGLLESSLPDAEIRQTNEGAVAQQRPLTKAPETNCFGQRRIGLRPPSGRGQHAAVVRTAEGGDRRKPPAIGDRFADPDPLVGACDVVRVLARREELAEDLFEHHEVVDLAARHGREGLVEQHHALFGAVGVDETRSQVGERDELQIGVAEAAGEHEGLSEELLLASPVALEHRDVERDPSALRRLDRVDEECLRSREPAARNRTVTDDRHVHVRERPSNANGTDVVSGVAVGRVRPLPAVDRREVVELEIRGAGQALDHIADSRCANGLLEGATCPGGIAGPQGSASLSHELLEPGGHAWIVPRAAMPSRPTPATCLLHTARGFVWGRQFGSFAAGRCIAFTVVRRSA